MALQLAPEEPEAGPWGVELLSTVANTVTRRGPDRSTSGRPAVLAINGRSNSGKTTLAVMVPGAGRSAAAVEDSEPRMLLKTISPARAACGWEPRWEPPVASSGRAV
jgi:hypothetical protein